ncbi:conserved hypothetical protein [Trichinella spiralis]|uniref:Uncharacterized protein n=1 Tax=Trichinella spiralis TaxID=6334 RepID=E5S654_TRISP|nr:conserved hypothetical protein [Trichinella spiralis]KRY36835.1 hypothetical protein T01_14470 [Trichinella spiralis]
MDDYKELFTAKLKLLLCCMDDYKCYSNVNSNLKAFSKDRSSNLVSSTKRKRCSDVEQNLCKNDDSKDDRYVVIFAERLRAIVSQMEIFLQRFGAHISSDDVEETFGIIKKARECLDDADT